MPCIQSLTHSLIYLIFIRYACIRSSLVAQSVKSLPAMWEIWVQSLGQEDPLEKEMATHSSILAWRIPWTEEPGGLQFMRLQRVGRDWVTNTDTQGCYNKLSQTGQPRTQKFIASHFGRPEVWNQGIRKTMIPLKSPWKDLTQASLPAFGSLRHSLACRWPSSPCVSSYNFFTETLCV